MKQSESIDVERMASHLAPLVEAFKAMCKKLEPEFDTGLDSLTVILAPCATSNLAAVEQAKVSLMVPDIMKRMGLKGTRGQALLANVASRLLQAMRDQAAVQSLNALASKRLATWSTREQWSASLHECFSDKGAFRKNKFPSRFGAGIFTCLRTVTTRGNGG